MCLLHQLLNSERAGPSSEAILRDVPAPRLVRRDPQGVKWLLSLRSRQMLVLANEGLSSRKIGDHFGINRGGVKAAVWRARHQQGDAQSSEGNLDTLSKGMSH